MPQTNSDSGKRVFLIHLGIYLVVNAILAAINLSQTPGEGQLRELWFFWPLAGWGVGLSAHAFAVLFEQKTKGDGLFADKNVQGFIVHLFIYVAVNLMLAIIDLSGSNESLWFYWPLLGWGIALAAHALLVYLANRRRAEMRSRSDSRHTPRRHARSVSH